MSPDEIAAEAIRRGAVQKREELAGLLALLAEDALSVAVEIGVYRGGTLWAWSQLARAAYGIDSGAGLDPGARLQAPTGAHVLEADSHDPATVGRLRDLVRRPVDFLFIDGDHTYDGVRRDYELYAPLVRPGGWIAFHDVLHHQDPDMGVERFWGEIRPSLHWEFVAEPTWWGGIGVLRR